MVLTRDIYSMSLNTCRVLQTLAAGTRLSLTDDSVSRSWALSCDLRWTGEQSDNQGYNYVDRVLVITALGSPVRSHLAWYNKNPGCNGVQFSPRVIQASFLTVFSGQRRSINTKGEL